MDQNLLNILATNLGGLHGSRFQISKALWMFKPWRLGLAFSSQKCESATGGSPGPLVVQEVMVRAMITPG